jgi:2-polyprenyl-3-methyl-5-hydroxy-6-metoxy-1,4-benzoquinol methylase
MNETGQVSRALAPYVAQLVGVDISPRMVEVYNARANAQGLEPHEMRAVGSLAELQQQRFDVIVVRKKRAHTHTLSLIQVAPAFVCQLNCLFFFACFSARWRTITSRLWKTSRASSSRI